MAATVSFDNLLPLPGSKPGERLVIAGPCSAESAEQMSATARALAEDSGIRILRAGLWKPRTMPGTFEGVGAEGLPWLVGSARDNGMLAATEVATAAHVEAAMDAGVDMLWLGARTVGDPFAVQEIADAIAGRGADRIAVLVKNPLSPDINLWLGALSRIYNAGVRRLGAIHRGFTPWSEPTPYRNEPLWSIAFELRRRLPALPLLCDPSHIAGRADLVAEVARRAVDTGFDGLIIESHCCPGQALSDAAQQLTPEATLQLLKSLPGRVPPGVAATAGLAAMRERLDLLDNQILRLLAERMEVASDIGLYKKEHAMTALQPDRYTAVIDSRIASGREMGLDAAFLRRVWANIHEESVRRQLDVIGD